MTLRGHLDEARGELCQRTRARGRRAHGSAAVCIVPSAGVSGMSSGPLTGRIGRHGQQAQRPADYSGKHRRRDLAAHMLPGTGLIDHHDRGQARRGGRRDPAEHGHVAIRRVAARLGLERGAGLARDAVAGDRGQLAGALGGDDRLEHRDQFATDMLIEHALALRRAFQTQERHRPHEAKAADGRVAVCQLQWRHREAVAVRHHRDADRPPLRVAGEQARGLSRIATGGDLTETQVREGFPDLLRRQRQGEVRHADVGALGEHRGDVDGAEVVLVIEDPGAYLDESGRGIDDAVVVVLAGGQARGHEERLDGGTRLEDVRRRAVAVGRRLDLVAVVRVVGRLVDHGQHLAGLHVDHDDGAGPGALVADRRLEFPVGQVLDAQVDREHQVPARARRADALHVLHDAPVAVLDDPLRAVLAGQPVVEGELEALLAGIVDIGEAQQVTGHLAGGVVAAVLARGVHPGNPQRLDLLGLGRLAVPGDVEELAVEIARDAPRQLLAVELERRGQARNLVRRQRQLARVHPDRVHRGAHGQRLAVAVGHRAAVRGDVQHAREARVTLLRQEAVVHQLQVHRPVHQAECAAGQQPEQQVRPPAETTGRVLAWAAGPHGAMISISFGGGIAICSFAFATRSTKAWVDQALCSSCSWPHSISRLSRRPLSASSSMNRVRARCLQ